MLSPSPAMKTSRTLISVEIRCGSEPPGEGGADRHRAAQPDDRGMVRRRQVALLDVVARAGLADTPLQIDAEAVDHVAGPAAAVALHFERLFGGENAAIARALDVEQEVALLAEQAEAVADLPGDLQRRVGGGLRGHRPGLDCSKEAGKQDAGEN